MEEKKKFFVERKNSKLEEEDFMDCKKIQNKRNKTS